MVCNAPVPCDDSLPLVGDAQGHHVARCHSRGVQAVPNDALGVAPDLARAVLHLAGGGEVLRVLLLLLTPHHTTLP